MISKPSLDLYVFYRGGIIISMSSTLEGLKRNMTPNFRWMRVMDFNQVVRASKKGETCIVGGCVCIIQKYTSVPLKGK